MIHNSLFKLLKNNSRFFFKYCLGGGVAFLVDLSLLYIFTEYLHLWYIYSATLSFVITAVVNYTIQKYWTFKNDSRQIFRQLTIFISIQILGLILNNILLYCLVEFLGLWYIVGKIIAAGIVLIWNFGAGKAFVFNVHDVDISIAGEIFPPSIGGPATYTYRLARYLLADQISFSVVYYGRLPSSPNDHDLTPFLTRISSRWPLPLKYFFYFLKLFSRSIHAKVIYAQGPVSSGWPALMVSRLLKKKLVVKVVGDYAWEQARLERASRQGVDDWQQGPDPHSHNYWLNLKLNWLNKIERSVVRRADYVIVPSHYLKKIVLGWGADQNKIKVIYNSIFLRDKTDLSRQAAQAQIKISGDLIITVARLLPWKGVDLLIKIMPELLKINPAFKLLIAGGGPEEDNLRQLVKENKLEQQVFVLGSLSQKELAVYYRASAIFALNSGYEGLSHSILDAMDYQLPIIASDIGGNPELVQDDYNGLLVAYNNQEAWINAFRRLWSNEKLRERLASSPLVKLDVFSFDTMIKETLKVIYS